MDRIKKLIENKLACMDIENKHSKGETKTTRYNYELNGMKQTLESLGITLEISTNPYFYKNGEPSTYYLKIA